MFLIGEFSKIARVSRRMLYYYEEVGLLAPAHIDEATGYRYYSASQIPRLNQILALKGLGLTLDQIHRMLHDNVSSDEIRGMLAMRKAQIEQQLADELAQIRQIESHIQQIDSDGILSDYDIVLKPVPAQRVLTAREIIADFPSFANAMFDVMRGLPAQVDKNNLGHMIAIAHCDSFMSEDVDGEFGYLVDDSFDQAAIVGSRTLTPRTLPAVETMATITRIGPAAHGGIYYQALGQWMEVNGYAFDGMGREVFLQLQPGRLDEMVVEIQYPVRRIAPDMPRLS